jgi:hypothetical protein
VYKWSTGVSIPADITLSGSAQDVWIFQIAQNLTVSSGAKVILTAGAQASNVFWVVAGQTTLGTGVAFSGTVLDQTAIVLNTGAILTGRALAQSAVTLDANTVALPSNVAIVATPVYVPTPVPTTAPTPTPVQSTYTPPDPYQSLTSQQKLQYDTLLAAGAYPSVALSAVGQIPVSISVSAPTNLQEMRMLTSTLMQQDRGVSVTTLQNFLITQNRGAAAQKLFAVGTSEYFGALTRAALAEFQASVGIIPALGNFGPITREYVATHYY